MSWKIQVRSYYDLSQLFYGKYIQTIQCSVLKTEINARLRLSQNLNLKQPAQWIQFLFQISYVEASKLSALLQSFPAFYAIGFSQTNKLENIFLFSLLLSVVVSHLSQVER
jgi:hypothetical protein